MWNVECGMLIPHFSFKKSSAPVSRVLYPCGRLSFIYYAGYPTSQAFYPPSCPEELGRTALQRWYTRTCSLQTEQPCDHPQAGGLLHHLLTLTPDAWGGHSLLPYPAVTNSWHFHQWSVLCCPDFPLALIVPATDRCTTFMIYCIPSSRSFCCHFQALFRTSSVGVSAFQPSTLLALSTLPQTCSMSPSRRGA